MARSSGSLRRLSNGGFDTVRHGRLLATGAQRVDGADAMPLLTAMLKASGKTGVPQGGVISPLLSNLHRNEAGRMPERAREVTRKGKHAPVEHARFADDRVVLIDARRRRDWLVGAADKRLREECDKLQAEINDEKSADHPDRAGAGVVSQGDQLTS